MLLVQFHLTILIHVSVVPPKHVEPVAGSVWETEMLECWHKVEVLYNGQDRAFAQSSEGPSALQTHGVPRELVKVSAPCWARAPEPAPRELLGKGTHS